MKFVNTDHILASVLTFSIGCAILAALSLFYGCGAKASSGKGYALEVPGPAGVHCFAIYDENGAVQGGSCLK